jgi:mitochondrial fission protein ELM1
LSGSNPPLTAPEPGPSASGDQLLIIWAVSDGRAGIQTQALGLAEALLRQCEAVGRKAQIVLKTVGWKGDIGRLPAVLNVLPKRWVTPESEITAPWPDVWIAAGRATLPLSVRMRAWSGGKTFVVQIQDPRMPLTSFDLVIPPKHDRLTGENVLSIIGSPHRVTPEKLASEVKRFGPKIKALPHPRVAVLVGGRSKAFDLSPERASAMAHSIEDAIRHEGGSLMMTFSRRTPEKARALLTARLRHLPGLIWNGEGENPYFALLGAADYILVTEDSTNMATEAASTGKPVFVLKMDGSSLKFSMFHSMLEGLGATRPYDGVLRRWSYEPVQETQRAAAAILEQLTARQA